MDPTDDAFFREAKSQIRTLSDGLLALERGDGGDSEVGVAELFRVAHSLKGSCHTHGLSEAGELAHALEDALDAFRAGEVEPTPALIDDALETVDLLEATVRDAAIDDGVDGDPEAAREALRATLDRERAESPADSPTGADAFPAEPATPADDWDPADDDLSDDVVEALEETTKFDDIDSLLDGMDDSESDEELDGWGMLGDESAEDDPTADTSASDDPSRDDQREISSGDDSSPTGEPREGATPDEPASFFEQTKAEIDDEDDIGELQADIDAVEFGEFDDEDNYTIEELIELEPDESGEKLESGEPAADESGEESGPAAEGATDQSGLNPAAASLDLSAESPDAEVESGTSEPESSDAEAAPGNSDGVSDNSTNSLDSSGIASDSESESTASESPVDAADDPLGLADDDSRPNEADASASSGPADAEPVEADSDSTDDESGTTTFVFGDPEDDISQPADTSRADDIPEADDGREADKTPGADDLPEIGDGPVTSESESVPTDDSVPDADSLPDLDSVTETDSLSASDSLPDPDSLPESESVPDSDSVPEADLGVDLSGDFGEVGDDLSGGLGEEAGDLGETGLDVSVDEEMEAFESRFGDLLGEGPAGDEDDEAVFRSAVSTIEESRLDADQFPTAETAGSPGETGEFDRLQAMTVDVDTADRLLNVAEELSLTHLRLDEAVDSETDDAIREEVSNLLRIVTDYRRTVMDVRLMALETAIDTIPRTVRDVARAQDKEVSVVVNDADVELDRSILDRLRDPLVHLARNAVDHGIESPGDREEAGKPREGTVEISAERVGDEVVIELSDDGRGVDAEAVRERAIERGVVSPAEAKRLGEAETYDLLFEPGFTTTEEVTDVSGRGVGMNVVNRTIADLNGTVTVESEPGAGTTVRLTVPVSIALTEVLFVEVEGRTFGIPMTAVEQITATPLVETVEGREVVRRSDLDLVGGLPEGVEAEDAYPHVDLREALELSGAGSDPESKLETDPGSEAETKSEAETEPEHETDPAESGSTADAADDQIVWIRAETGRRAVRCDRVVASQEVVVRPYGDLLRDVPGVSGATTLGDGRAVNVLDVGSI